MNLMTTASESWCPDERTCAIRCAHVVAGIGHEASGPSYSVPRLCAELQSDGLSVELHVGDAEPQYTYPFPLHWYPPPVPLAARLGYSPAMEAALRQAVHRLDLIHTHGLWLMPNIYPSRAVRGTSCRLVTSPRGTLSRYAFKRSRWRKVLMWKLAQARALSVAACFHATSEAECADIRSRGFQQPIAVIPNGFDIPRTVNRQPRMARRRLLYLGRIHPIKGLMDLVSAWRQLQNRPWISDWDLHIVGPGEPRHVSQLAAHIAGSGAKRLILRGPVYGPDKNAEYSNADVYILPSYSENFAMTVAEALAHGVPAIATKATPWRGLEANGCGWWVDNGVEPLLAAMSDSMQSSPDRLLSMGSRGRDWIEREFSWPLVSRQMIAVYHWLLVGGEPPDCVRLS